MWWHSLALCVHVCIPHCIGLVDYLFMFYFLLQLLCVFFFCSVLHYRHIPFALKFYKKSKFYQNQMYIRAASTFLKMYEIQACTMSRLLHLFYQYCANLNVCVQCKTEWKFLHILKM